MNIIIIIIIIIINFIRTDQYPRANKIMFYSSKSDSQINTHNKNLTEKIIASKIRNSGQAINIKNQKYL